MFIMQENHGGTWGRGQMGNLYCLCNFPVNLRVEKLKVGEFGKGHVHTAVFKMHNQQRPAV